ncbi:hypothetical protein EEB18_011810 [Sphingopyxis sp. OPL5]|uniref:hypothetical protein n=1 Tax=Sphingopyxis sp. OPL5 TaxID=2486273 RepID=UPI00164DD028|nr:hypothetical protein [Sphingopyxis sp. OPL5]QNO25494.1 hypothetical protein EEB18_011810 [Sphingopyxis sp. OPL5]
MAKIKSAGHHWWPECVSEHWADDDGGVTWLLPDNSVRKSVPKNFGLIGNGHTIKIGENPSEVTPWDTSFEAEFQVADDNFPSVIDWLYRLDRCYPPFSDAAEERIVHVSAADKQFEMLIECIVSLAVRSPKHRETAVALAEEFRGPLPEWNRNSLIGVNMRNSQRNAVRSIRSSGKAMVIFSPDREFVFGDGFFHNILAPVEHLHGPKILVPLTPWMAVLFAKPSSYRLDPRLVTLVATPSEVDALNYAVQVYARNAIFYRSERPTVTDVFALGKHMVFASPRNSVDELIHKIPGIPPRDTSLDAIFYPPTN